MKCHEGCFSIKGAQEAIQLAAHCVGRDPKARPLVSEVVEALKPLPNLKDVACSSSHFQGMQAERAGFVTNARIGGGRVQGGFPSRNVRLSSRISMPNGPHVSPYHHDHLHLSPKPDVGQSSGSLPLPWSTRMEIALGVAKGVAFLHEDTERPVNYRDFKTANSLLDADYNAKRSDSGLAKDGPEGDKTHVSWEPMVMLPLST